eukprot:353301-Chlamydomonas_euryale.AAC.6
MRMQFRASSAGWGRALYVRRPIAGSSSDAGISTRSFGAAIQSPYEKKYHCPNGSCAHVGGRSALSTHVRVLMLRTNAFARGRCGLQRRTRAPSRHAPGCRICLFEC